MKINYLIIGAVAFLSMAFSKSKAQTIGIQNGIQTAVPFLRLAPDARSAAMGDAGVATSSDANAIHFNPAKLAFIDTKLGVSLSYSPRLRKIVNDRFLANAAAYYKLDHKSTLALHFTYIDLGDFFSQSFIEYSVGGAYALQVADKVSIGVGIKYIYSKLPLYTFTGFTEQDGRAFAGDISLYYKNRISLLSKQAGFAFGASILHLGTAITYSDKNNRQYIPTTLKFGPALSYPVDKDNQFTLTLDVNKLLVPSINQVVPRGQAAMFSALRSFADAPRGFSEELREFYYACGAEYSLKQILFLRGGYYWEHRDKGNNKYFTLGGGLRYKMTAFDFSYLIGQDRWYLNRDTMHFTLRLNVG